MSKQELHPRTAVLNKNQKNQSRKQRSQALAWLAANFPSAFDNSLCIRPLKVGIMDDILVHADKAAQEGISRSKLREAVVLFTRRLDYLACLKSREMRIDLHGNSIIEVSLEEADNAASKIRKRVEKSARNARKLMATKGAAPVAPNSPSNAAYVKATSHITVDSDDFFPTYPTRSANYHQQSPASQQTKTPAVLVKHKATKQYDPSAVARLKEKLGLSRSMEEKKEAVE